MLARLFISNFALIDRLELELHQGFNVLTGETGAGKSIIIDAVSVVTGGQGLTDFIRSGNKKAIVEAVFETETNSRVQEILQEYGFLPEKGEFLILTREIVKSGKNTCRINGRTVNLSIYREIARVLIDIYGQHHQQSLLDPQKHIEFLDETGGRDLSRLKSEIASVYTELVLTRKQLRNMEANEKEQARMADMFRYQLEEIDRCSPVAEEDIKLEEEKTILANSERLMSLAATAHDVLYEGSKTRPVTEQLHEALNAVREVCLIDPDLNSVSEMMESALYQIEEAARDIRTYSQKLEIDPNRLEDVENRLNLIRGLKKKYGDSITEIIRYRDQIAASLSEIDNYDGELKNLNTKLDEINSQYDRMAGRLTEARCQAAEELKKKITFELKELNMPHVTFDVKIEPGEPSLSGKDSIEFLISPNKGEPLKSLAKIVSGGEVSRIMLAFRAIMAKNDPVATLIFDEIDAGIGGNALRAVAQKLAAVGRERQVICVTHSPQIAGTADHHFVINKLTDDSRTFTQVTELDSERRIEELARMLSGGKITSVTRKHAEEILKHKS